MSSGFRPFLCLLLMQLIGIAGAGASPLTTLHSFCTDYQNKHCLDGSTPASRLVEVGGQFYGTATAGGSRQLGTIFRISSTGSFTLLHTFCQEPRCTDSARPGRYLTGGPSGSVYGVSLSGGTADGGAIFKLSSGGSFSLVHKFCSEARCADGLQPVSVLFDGGTLFGTTTGGGSHGSGTAFMIDASGTEHVLYNFCSQANCTDGISPGALIRGRDGNFYGTTAAGGKNQAGTVFRMTPTGTMTVLYSFCTQANCADGERPAQILVQGKSGSFYGTTGGAGANSGTVFEISPAGALHTLHIFCQSDFCRDGATPVDGLVLAKDGSFYGTVASGSRFYSGSIFHLTPTGDYSLVYDFCAEHGCFDGVTPALAPILGSDGMLYGVTGAGGRANNAGTVYRLQP